jgi:hypothetical protein
MAALLPMVAAIFIGEVNMAANAGTTRPAGKTGACDEALGKPPKPETVKDAVTKSGVAQKCNDTQAGSNGKRGN